MAQRVVELETELQGDDALKSELEEVRARNEELSNMVEERKEKMEIWEEERNEEREAYENKLQEVSDLVAQ